MYTMIDQIEIYIYIYRDYFSYCSTQRKESAISFGPVCIIVCDVTSVLQLVFREAVNIISEIKPINSDFISLYNGLILYKNQLV
jgi:hypothetical protein